MRCKDFARITFSVQGPLWKNDLARGSCPNYFSRLDNAVSVPKLLLMCLKFHIRVVHFFGMLKKKSICMQYLFLLSQKAFFPGLPNLGAQIRCAHNRYTAVQTDLKYPLVHPSPCGNLLKGW